MLARRPEVPGATRRSHGALSGHRARRRSSIRRGQRTEQVIEHRTDPLTGTVASLNAAFGEKAKAFIGTGDLPLLEELQEKSRAGCPFCSAAERGTRFVPEISAEPQLRVGRSLAVPNLFAKCGFDAVVIVDPALHVLFPSRLPAAALADALRASAEMVRLARASDAARVHHVAGMNFLHPGRLLRPAPAPAGARAQRPLLRPRAGDGARRRAPRPDRPELLRRAPRARARGRGVDTSGAPARSSGSPPGRPPTSARFWGILPGTGSLVEAKDADLASFAEGISRVVSFYEEGGVHPFTLAFQSSPWPGARGSGRST